MEGNISKIQSNMLVVLRSCGVMQVSFHHRPEVSYLLPSIEMNMYGVINALDLVPLLLERYCLYGDKTFASGYARVCAPFHHRCATDTDLSPPSLERLARRGYLPPPLVFLSRLRCDALRRLMLL
jgi:hypothetical protein